MPRFAVSGRRCPGRQCGKASGAARGVVQDAPRVHGLEDTPAGGRGERLQPGWRRQHGRNAVTEIGARPDSRAHVAVEARTEALGGGRAQGSRIGKIAAARVLSARATATRTDCAAARAVCTSATACAFSACSADAASVVPAHAAALGQVPEFGGTSRAASHQQSRQGCRKGIPLKA